MQDNQSQDHKQRDRHHDDDHLAHGDRQIGDASPALRDFKSHVIDQRRKRLGIGTEGKLPCIFEKEGNADGGDENRKPRLLTERPVAKPLDEDTDPRAGEHRRRQDQPGRPVGRVAAKPTEHLRPHKQAGECPQHIHIAVSEIDEAQDPENHRVPERDQSVDRPERDSIDELLEKFDHSAGKLATIPCVNLLLK